MFDSIDENADYSSDLLGQWSETLNLIADIFNISSVLIMKLDCDKIKVFAKNKNDKNPYQIGDSDVLQGSGLYCERVVKTQALLEVKNALKDPDWDKNPDIKLNQIYYLGVPITSRDGEEFGTLCILDDHERTFDSKYHQLLFNLKDNIVNQLHSYDLQRQVMSQQNVDCIEKLICGMAHQLNTPTGISITATSTLNTVFTELSDNLHHKTLTQKQLTEFEQTATSCLDLIQVNLNKTAYLVDRFKQISSQFSSNITEVMIDIFLQGMVNVFKIQYPNNVKFILNTPAKIHLITIPHLLQNALTQLVDNSIEHGFLGRESDNEIVINIEKLNNGIDITYVDNGCGIAKSMACDVFMPFSSLEKGSNLGLGLSVVQNIIVMQLKGQISLCEHEHEHGVKFKIHLPSLSFNDTSH
ncbi:GAF domain-containing sensor histidine kinase [Psychromonas sp. Urea-02u-13]|uniref:GAF domain-containing sensor histidine kinase n=1 Tax=Psychromonas sp. Urea-02u-13 TaxID=2058326 RepID=UPI0012FECB03|nr:GAF domain-containing sensor histidine kinase [Psychromonas sp. Urea-02u-13]